MKLGPLAIGRVCYQVSIPENISTPSQSSHSQQTVPDNKRFDFIALVLQMHQSKSNYAFDFKDNYIPR